MASLTRSNKHLATAAKRQKAVRLTIATSSAIEGIHAPFKGKVASKTAAKGGKLKPAKRAKSA